jgi:hypothetical protein
MQEYSTDKQTIQQFIEHIKIQKGANKCSTYILPMLATEIMKYKENFCTTNFRAVFLGDTTKKKDLLDNKIILMYRFSGVKQHLDLENCLLNHPLFEIYYECDKLHTLYVFRIPENFKKDYQLFKEWKPSKFSNEYKKLIIEFYRNSQIELLKKIIYKDYTLKKELEQKIAHKLPENNELSSVPVWFIEYYQKEFNMKAPREKMESLTKEFEI